MSAESLRCSTCGAAMKPDANGRLYACHYCGAEVQAAIDATQIAAGLKLDLANADAFLNGLATALHGHLGTRTTLRAAGGRVDHFEINLDPDLFVVKREGHGVVAQYKKLVRGVALKTHTHPLDRWVQLLTKALASHANENARVAQVLATLKGG
ncbi:MAG: transposase [Deltaproteobacteria bacterium]|nr:transposase [Deltaproteobacteria bacterium]